MTGAAGADSELVPNASQLTAWKGVVAAGFGVLAVAWALSQLGRPLAQDQGIFAAIADVIASGGLPYRDAWEVKGPGLLYSWAGIQVLFGGEDWGAHFADVLIFAGGLLCVRHFAKRLRPEAALPAVAVLFAWYAGLDFYNTAQPDGWVGMLLALGSLLLLPPNGLVTARAAFACGLILGWCTLFKPVYALFGVVPLARSWVDARREPGATLRNLGVLVLGGAIPVALMAGWFWYQRSLTEFIEANILYTATAYGSGGLFLKVRSFVDALVKSPGLTLGVLLALAGLREALRLYRAAGAVLAAWFFATGACVALQAKYWSYHWTPFLYPVAIAAALGALWLGRVVARAFRVGPRAAQVIRITLTVLVLIAMCVGSTVRTVEAIGRWANSRLQPASRASYECAEFNYYGGCPMSLGRMAEHIKQRTAPSDRILMWGNKSLIYHLSGRRQASRFGWNWALVRLPGNPYREKYRAELLAAVRASPPTYVIARVRRACDGSPAAELECLSSFPELASFVTNHYHLEDSVGIYGMYRVERSR